MSVSKLFLEKWQKVGRTLTKTFIKIRAELGYEFGLFYQDLLAEVCFLKVNVTVVENIARETDGVGCWQCCWRKVANVCHWYVDQTTCLACPTIDSLKSFELIFLPPITTSKTQPMDQGLIRSLKVFYWHSLIKCYIRGIGQGKFPDKIQHIKRYDFANCSLGPIITQYCNELL